MLKQPRRRQPRVLSETEDYGQDDLHRRSLRELEDAVLAKTLTERAGDDVVGTQRWDFAVLRGFVLVENNTFRFLWTGATNLLLVYLGSIFIYRIAFIEFYSGTLQDRTQWWYTSRYWVWLDNFMNAFFWLDLVVQFFFTYRNHSLVEIKDLKKTARNYLRTRLVMDLLSSTPAEIFELVFQVLMDYLPKNSNQALRLTRLQRISRLANLSRIAKMAKIGSASGSRRTSEFLEHHKSLRLLMLGFALLWIVHLLCCGWYIVAFLHEDVRDTWVYRRTLLAETPGIHWVHAGYFVLTVFSTVGFGDIAPVQRGEICYTCLLMVVGVVFHSMLISEVITVVTKSDKFSNFLRAEQDLVEDYAEHAEIPPDVREAMKNWVCVSGQELYKEFNTCAKSEMVKLINTKLLSRRLRQAVPSALYGGSLLKNRIFKLNQTDASRLPMLFALWARKATCWRGDIVYQEGDSCSGAHLVLGGVFAYVAHITPVGDDLSMARTVIMKPYTLFPWGTYFGDMELFADVERLSTARCETSGGSVLTISSEHIKEIGYQFPEFHRKLSDRAAEQRDRFERSFASRQDVNSYKDLAAVRIQKQIRLRRLKIESRMAGFSAQAFIQASCRRSGRRRHSDVNGAGQADSHRANGHSIVADKVWDKVAQLDDRLTKHATSTNLNLANLNRKLDALTNMISTLVPQQMRTPELVEQRTRACDAEVVVNRIAQRGGPTPPDQSEPLEHDFLRSALEQLGSPPLLQYPNSTDVTTNFVATILPGTMDDHRLDWA